MPVKYECPRCEKRFVDWGAQKLNFKCPTCDGEQLIKVGSSEDRPVKRPSLRKRGAKAARVREEVALPVADVEEEEFAEEEVESEVLIGAGAGLVVKEEDDFDEEAVVDDEEAELVDDEAVPQDLEFEEESMGSIDLNEKNLAARICYRARGIEGRNCGWGGNRIPSRTFCSCAIVRISRGSAFQA